jgi:TonB family protein
MSNRRLCRFHHACSAILACALILPTLVTSSSHAQTAEQAGKPGRKLIYKVDPDYPWDLKRAHIGGVVRMIVIVTPRGTIDSVSVVGGNPVLVETALRAVKRWKYSPADSESIIHVNVDFNPAR